MPSPLVQCRAAAAQAGALWPPHKCVCRRVTNGLVTAGLCQALAAALGCCTGLLHWLLGSGLLWACW
jgi:hypothetical protein